MHALISITWNMNILNIQKAKYFISDFNSHTLSVLKYQQWSISFGDSDGVGDRYIWPYWTGRVKLLLHTELRLKIGVLIDGIVDQQLMRGFGKPLQMQDFVRVSFLPMRLFELNLRHIKLLFPCFFNLSFKMCCTKKIYWD